MIPVVLLPPYTPKHLHPHTHTLSRQCWECLGDAYLSRGSYNSALNAFNKCLEVLATCTCKTYATTNKLLPNLYTAGALLPLLSISVS